MGGRQRAALRDRPIGGEGRGQIQASQQSAVADVERNSAHRIAGRKQIAQHLQQCPRAGCTRERRHTPPRPQVTANSAAAQAASSAALMPRALVHGAIDAGCRADSSSGSRRKRCRSAGAHPPQVPHVNRLRLFETRQCPRRAISVNSARRPSYPLHAQRAALHDGVGRRHACNVRACDDASRRAASAFFHFATNPALPRSNFVAPFHHFDPFAELLRRFDLHGETESVEQLRAARPLRIAAAINTNRADEHAQTSRSTRFSPDAATSMSRSTR